MEPPQQQQQDHSSLMETGAADTQEVPQFFIPPQRVLIEHAVSGCPGAVEYIPIRNYLPNLAPPEKESKGKNKKSQDEDDEEDKSSE